VTPLVRLYIKTSFVFLIAGLVLGGYIAVEVNLLGRAVPWPLITAHVHLLLVGFLLTLVFGVATWMFPRPVREDVRYRPWLAWLVYWLLAASTVVRALGELGAAIAGARGSLLAALGGLGQLVAAAAFVVNMWTRVRMPGGVAPPPPPSLR
jgi:heme/copper-type cytochrome/quinol oxidase subunit 1